MTLVPGGRKALFQEAAVLCIIATEFCERFSFCGLRTILSIFLRNELQFNEGAATVIYHVFIMICYTIPVVGAICADSILGRYSTILYFSIVYLLGNLLLCISAVPVLEELFSISSSFIGLLLISIGTGGIKPCVAAFGADQFQLPQEKVSLQHFFHLFYFTINLGGFVGMVITPILRKWITCFGEETCYTLGFGFPAFLMVISICKYLEIGFNLGLFTLQSGSFSSTKPCFSTVHHGQALVSTKNSKEEHDTGSIELKRLGGNQAKKHWLNYAKTKYDLKLIQDMKLVFSILFLYTPLPIFWSLFDQQGSRWTFQASHMNGNIFGLQILPDQMQVVNPAMVLLLIPVFDKLLCRFENSLGKMAIGGLFTSAAFFSAGVLELFLEHSTPEDVKPEHCSINVINSLPCNVLLLNPFNQVQEVHMGEMYQFENFLCRNYSKLVLGVEPLGGCSVAELSGGNFKIKVAAFTEEIRTIMLGVNSEDKLEAFQTSPVDLEKSLSGKPKIRILYLKTSPSLTNVSVTFKSETNLQDLYFVSNFNASFLIVSPYFELTQGVYDCVVTRKADQVLYEQWFHLGTGGIYSLVIRERRSKIEIYTMSEPNSISMLWLLPQYFLISIGEILFGISGLEFSFTQAPKSMKTVTIAGWYLSVAVGNLLVIVITKAKLFWSQSQEFFFFGVVMVADMIIFIKMAEGYKFVKLEGDSSGQVGQEHEEDKD